MAAPELPARLSAAMDAQKISVRRLAAASGVDKMTIQRWKQEDHEGGVEVEAARKVAEALGTSVEALLDLPAGPETPTQPPEPPIELSRLRELAAGLDPEALATFEQTLPTIREAVEELRRH
ncbi:MAG TPA: helix-turn-helix transcriptional regulator [Solirubrobacterales bacterium]